MANLGQKDGIFHIRFRYLQREYKKSLKIRSRANAEAARSLVELTIHRLMTGQLSVPGMNVDTGDFIISGGTLTEPSIKPVAALETPYDAGELDRLGYKESQKNLLAESYHYSQAMHLRHLAKHLGAQVNAAFDQIGFRELDGYLKARLAIPRHRGHIP